MFAGLLIHRVQVKRTSGRLDRFGQPADFPYPTDGDEYACRCTTASGGERNAERSREVYMVKHTVFIEPGADVKEDDNVRVYDPANGYVIIEDGDITVIKRVYALGSLHHIEAQVDVVRGPIGAS